MSVALIVDYYICSTDSSVKDSIKITNGTAVSACYRILKGRRFELIFPNFSHWL